MEWLIVAYLKSVLYHQRQILLVGSWPVSSSCGPSAAALGWFILNIYYHSSQHLPEVFGDTPQKETKLDDLPNQEHR